MGVSIGLGFAGVGFTQVVRGVPAGRFCDPTETVVPARCGVRVELAQPASITADAPRTASITGHVRLIVALLDPVRL
jgi:hypothetical protein